MPYHLKKKPGTNLYWVATADGKYLSKDPIPLARAKKQMAAVYANERPKI